MCGSAEVGRIRLLVNQPGPRDQGTWVPRGQVLALVASPPLLAEPWNFDVRISSEDSMWKLLTFDVVVHVAALRVPTTSHPVGV